MLKTRKTRVEERKEEKRSEKRDRILRAAEAIFLGKLCKMLDSSQWPLET